MGSYAPVSDLPPGLLETVRETILRPAIDGLRAEGRPYRGALYAGLMLTREGPMALEFNCRFGDPETQVILPLLAGDLAEALRSCAVGRLDPEAVAVDSGAAVCVVLAAEGYPVRPRQGDAILGIDEAIGRERALHAVPLRADGPISWPGESPRGGLGTGALVFQAGTALRDGELVTNGGRVLSVVGLGRDVAEAGARAYDAADLIQFAGKQMRRDIAMALVPLPA
jgi:phosphoribosylamine--glycine ligase